VKVKKNKKPLPDFEVFSRNIESYKKQLEELGERKKKNPNSIHAYIEPLKEAILKQRENGLSWSAIGEWIDSIGLHVSMPTLKTFFEEKKSKSAKKRITKKKHDLKTHDASKSNSLKKENEATQQTSNKVRDTEV
jgi:hypothetical protein